MSQSVKANSSPFVGDARDRLGDAADRADHAGAAALEGLVGRDELAALHARAAEAQAHEAVALDERAPSGAAQRLDLEEVLLHRLLEQPRAGLQHLLDALGRRRPRAPRRAACPRLARR